MVYLTSSNDASEVDISVMECFHDTVLFPQLGFFIVVNKCTAEYLKKLWMDDDKTWWMSWVGDKKSANYILDVRMQIRLINGIQNVNYSAWWRYALYRVPFQSCI